MKNKVKKKSAKKRGEGRVFDSMSSCAGATGLAIATLKHAKSMGCSAFVNGRIAENALMDWLADDKNTDADSSDWFQAKAKVQTQREEIKLAKEKKQAIDFALVQIALSKGMAALFSQMDRTFSVELPPSLKGLDEPAIKAKCLAAVEVFKEALKFELNKLSEDQPTEEK